MSIEFNEFGNIDRSNGSLDEVEEAISSLFREMSDDLVGKDVKERVISYRALCESICSSCYSIAAEYILRAQMKERQKKD